MTEDLPNNAAADVTDELEAEGIATCKSSADMVLRLKPILADQHLRVRKDVTKQGDRLK